MSVGVATGEAIQGCRASRWRRSQGTTAAMPVKEVPEACDEKDVDSVPDVSGKLVSESTSPSEKLLEEEATLVDAASSASGGVGARWRRPLSADCGGASANAPSPMICSDSLATAASSSTSLAPGSTVLLRSGLKVPVLGLGTRRLKAGSECKDAVRAALRSGYFLLDTAASYGNEEDVGLGIKAAGLRRDDVFIVSKLPPNHHGDADDVREALGATLQKLGTTYVDLYLIQNPKGGDILDTWDAILALRDSGRAKAVGVAGFSRVHLEALAATGRELPEVLQLELHFANQQRDLVAYAKRSGIALMAAAPLAQGRLFGAAQTALAGIAARRGRTEAEIAIRWCMQLGCIPLPKSKDVKRIESNAVFGFSLNSSDMAEIAALDRGFSCTPLCKAAKLSWDHLLDEYSEVSDDDAMDGKGTQRRRRRRRRKGKGKDKGKGKGKGGGGGGGGGSGGGSAATRWSDTLTSLR